MPRFNRRYWFERTLVLLLLVIQTMVVVVGVLNYRKMNKVIEKAQVPETVSPGIQLQRSIIAELTEAERNAKSFYLTRKGNYLADYYSSVYRFSPLIDKMDSISWADERQAELTDTLVDYYEKELFVLNDLIYLENNEHVTDELTAISQTAENLKLDSVFIPVPKTAEEKKKNKRSFLNRIFGRHSDDTAKTVSDSGSYQLVVGNSARSDIKKQVTKVKGLQSDKLKEIKTREFELTDKIIRLSARIRSTVERIEEIERDLIKSRNNNAISLAGEAKSITFLFSLLILFMLFVSSIVVIRYFIDNNRQRKKLSQETELARKLAESKQNMVANMSHEMRTPLNSIIGFTEQVLQTEMNAEQRDQVQLVKRSADHLLRVINDMLDNARLEAGKLKLDIVAMSPALCINDVFRVMQIQAQEKHLLLEKSISPEIPEYILGDPVRFSQVLINIVGNAIKYTREGSVRIHASLQNKQLKLVISDTGTGIPADKLQSVFNRFEQASEKLAGSGSGLGLNIARQLIDLQSGSIQLESTVGKGTTVTILLPCEAVAAPEQPVADSKQNSLSNATLRAKKVLIADDEKFNRVLLISILRKYEVAFDEAENGLQVLEMVTKNNYDLILMDLRMPEMNGIEAAEKIRAFTDPGKSAVPIIALTAGLESEKLERCRKAGINEFLPKPYREQELLERMKTLLSPGL